jgi:predicted GNAT family N-acyltransferase
MALPVHVVAVPWSSHRDALRAVRDRVFIQEQQVPRALEWDGEDETASHFLAVDQAGRALGCARLLPSGQIGRMAVLHEHRGRGLGLRLLQEAIEAAKQQGFERVFVHAQAHAAGFYRKAGFLAVGGEFMEAGIPHQAMELALPIPFEPAGAVAQPLVRPQRPEPDRAEPRVLRFDGESACRDGLLRCLAQARRRLLLLSPLLDHALLDHEPLVEAVSRFARRSPSSQVRILLVDSSLVVSRGHRLVELARRLDSRIEIRRIPAELAPGDTSYATWDDRGFFLLPDFRDYSAVANTYEPVQAQRLGGEFTHLWDRSAPDPELRTLQL